MEPDMHEEGWGVTLEKAKQTLRLLDDEFKQDLAVHLYSFHLVKMLRELDPIVWAQWPPRPLNKPQTLSMYTDDPEKILPRVSGQVSCSTRFSNDRTDDDDDEDDNRDGERDDDDNNDDDSNDIMDAEDIMLLEIEALFKRRVHQKIQNEIIAGKHTKVQDANGTHTEYKLQPSVEISSSMTWMYKKIMTKLDHLIESVDPYVYSNSTGYPYINWKDILILSGTRDQTFLHKITDLFTTTAEESLEMYHKQLKTLKDCGMLEHPEGSKSWKKGSESDDDDDVDDDDDNDEDESQQDTHHEASPKVISKKVQKRERVISAIFESDLKSILSNSKENDFLNNESFLKTYAYGHSKRQHR